MKKFTTSLCTTLLLSLPGACLIFYGHVAAASVGVVVWGDNEYGQQAVPSDLSNVVAVSSGAYGKHTLALTADGRVVAWGWNSDGQATVPAGLSGVAGIAAGEHHNLAVKSNGTVVAWGGNFYGQTNVPDGLDNVIAVAAGSGHSLALKADGTVITWGIYSTNSAPPLSDVVAIAAGVSHNLALKADGTVVTWGDYAPPVPTDLSNVIAIAAGGAHSVALKSDGTVAVWGLDFYDQTNLPPGMTNVIKIAAGYGHTLALKADHTLVAWGWNYKGIATVPSGLTNVVLIAAGYIHSVAVGDSVDTPLAPIIITQPASQRAAAGSDVTFRVVTAGTELGYQWKFRGTNLVGSTNYSIVVAGTNSSLTIHDVQPIRAGNYSVVVSNAFGSVTSSNALLSVNHPPSVTNQFVVATEDAISAVPIYTMDLDNDRLSYAFVSPPIHGVLRGAVPWLTYTPSSNYFGPDQFTFKVNDGLVDSLPATIFITVRPVNDPPTARSQSVSVNEGSARSIVLDASDVDGDPLTYTVSSPQHGALGGIAPDLIYTPEMNYSGPDSFMFKVNDGHVNSADATISITVVQVNRAPVANMTLSPLLELAGVTNCVVISPNNTTATVVMDGSQSTDPEGQPLLYSWLEGTNIIATGVRATNEFAVGTHDVVLSVSDGTDAGTDVERLEVLAPAESVDFLIRVVNESALSNNKQRILIPSLNHAAAAFERNRFRVGINLLRDFERKVRAQVARPDPALARELIDDTEAIIHALEGS